MKAINRIKSLSIVLIAAYLLSACSGVPVRSENDPTGGGKGVPKEVAFTGSVDALSPAEITVGGQTVSMDTKTVIDPTIKVGDVVKVEAQVFDSGAVLALKVALFSAETTVPTAGSETLSPEATGTPSVEIPQVTDTPAPLQPTTAASEKELFGVVNAIAPNTMTVDGVVYQIASFTEIHGNLSVGDTVKLQVIANADGTLTIRQAEKVLGTGTSGDDENEDEHEDNGSNNTGNN